MKDSKQLFIRIPHRCHGGNLLAGIKLETLLRLFGDIHDRVATTRLSISTANKATYLNVWRCLRKMQELVGYFAGNLDWLLGHKFGFKVDVLAISKDSLR